LEIAVSSDTNKLEQRIASAIGNGSGSSGDLMELIAETSAAAEAAAQDAAAARDTALDLTASDLDTAHTALAACELHRDRLQAVLPKLRSRLTAALSSEATARWRGDFERVEKRRDEAAAKFARLCPELLANLVGLMREAEVVDQECLRVNGLAPSNEPLRLLGVELTARRLDAFSSGQPSISQTIRVPDWQHSAEMAWPPPQPDFAATFAATMPVSHDIRHTADWWRAAEADAAERRQLAERRAAEQHVADAARRAEYEMSLLKTQETLERRAQLRQRGRPDKDADAG
jgi:hypothetical protein